MIRRALYFFLATILLYLSSAIAQEKKTSKQAVEKRLKAVDRKSTRLNSSHSQISYAVFCLKKKKQLCDPRPIEGDIEQSLDWHPTNLGAINSLAWTGQVTPHPSHPLKLPYTQ